MSWEDEDEREVEREVERGPTWNHRVVRREHPEAVVEWERVSYAIHEAHYEAGARKPYAITTEPVAPYGETLDEVRETLDRMRRACEAPVLDYETREEVREVEHTRHGRGDAVNGPDDPDCPCRGTADEATCAAGGCGFCGAST